MGNECKILQWTTGESTREERTKQNIKKCVLFDISKVYFLACDLDDKCINIWGMCFAVT
jgi:hypothetical protein